MIVSKKDLYYYLNLDYQRNKISKKRYIFNRLIGNGKGKALCLLRRLRYYEYALNNKDKNLFFKVLYYYFKIRYERLEYKLDTYIWPNCVGPGLNIPHVGGIIINCISMGENCSVNKGVVIGNKKGQANRATIGNNCWFTLGCKVIGKVNIGDNVIVAQNSVVIKDIESNSIVSGVPAKVIKKFDDISEISI